MTVADLMERVAMLYNDSDYARVGQDMYLKFLDDALMQLVMVRPDAHLKTAVVQLDAGTKQELPDDCISLIDIFRNMGQDGLTDGRPCWQVVRKDMDYFADWHASPAEDPTEITEFAYDTKNAKTFWVSPAPGAGTDIYIEIMYSYPFEPFSAETWEEALTMDIPCDEVFCGAVISYMLYLLYSTDSSSKTDKVVGETYKADFYNQLGLEYKAISTAIPMPGDAVVAGGSRG